MKISNQMELLGRLSNFDKEILCSTRSSKTEARMLSKYGLLGFGPLYHNERFRDKECHKLRHYLSEANVIRVNQIIQYLPLKKLLCKKQLTLEKHLADITLSLKALLLSGIIMILTSPTLPYSSRSL